MSLNHLLKIENWKLKILLFCSVFLLFVSVGRKADAAVSNLGLVGYWSMNEGAGAFAEDYSGGSNRGILVSGPTWVDGKRGKALNFDGTNDNVQVKNTSAFALSGKSYTISLWVNYAITSAELATYDRFLSWLDGATNIQVGIANCTTVGACFYLNNASAAQVASVATNIALRNGWQHVIVIRNSTGPTYSIYVNGVSAGGGTTDASVGLLSGNTATVFIGQRGDGVAAAHTRGILDEIRIYNRVLSAAEIREIYQADAQRFTAPATNLGLVGYWNFNEGTGSYAGDSSGNGNQGILTNGPTWADGKRGKALSFDYVNDYVEAADKASLRVGMPSFTFAAWLKPGSVSGCGTDATSPGCIIFNKENSYEWAIANNGNINWAINNTSPGWAWRSSGLSAPSGVWTHIVITYNGSNIITYKNGGDSVNSQAGSGNVENTTNRNALRIGARNAPAAASSFFPGLIDEVRIYNRALSAAEIRTLYKSGAQKFTAPPTNLGLVGYWSMNEGTGSYAGDSSRNNNTGTLTNIASPPTSTSGWADGKRGKALNFDGVDDYVTMGDVLDFERTDTFSISAWYKLNVTSPTAQSRIVSKQDATTPFPGYSLQIRGDVAGDPLRFVLNVVPVSNAISVEFPRPNDTNWHHVVLTYTGSSAASGMQGYVDGVAQTMTVVSDTLTSTTLTAISFNIGNWDDNGTNGPFTGLIDEVRIYNRALSASEIQTLYKSGAGRIGL